MIRPIPTLTLVMLILCGCRSAGMPRFGTTSSPRYQPEIPKDTAASTTLDTAGVTIDHEELKVRQPILLASDEEASAADENPEPDGTSEFSAMSLEQTCALAVSRNPDLVTLRQSEHVSMAARGVAETYPFNPSLQVQATPWQDARNAGPGTMHHYVLLMQTIQLAHQQQFREQGAAFSLNSTRWNIHQAELQTLAQTQRLYFSALYLRGVRDLVEAGDRNNQQLLGILEHQLEAGQATASDVAIVRVDAASTRRQLQLASASYSNVLRDLARHAGISPNELTDVDGDLRIIEWKLPGADERSSSNSDEGIEMAMSASRSNALTWASSRPDVMAARSDIDVARANLCLASASKTPDLQIGPYYQTTADATTFFGFRGQIDLPVINNGQPLERQRLAEHHQRLTTWMQVQRRAELETQAAFDRYATALAANASDPSLDEADLPLDLTGLETQFRAGEVDVLRVIQARTSLIQNQRARLDLLNEVGQSAAALAGATGIPIEEFVLLRP